MWYKALVMGYLVRLEHTLVRSSNAFLFGCGFHLEVILLFFRVCLV